MRSRVLAFALLFVNVLLMTTLVFSDFYSLFTEQIYLLKRDNYFMLLASLPYYLYILVFGMKLWQEERTDPGMRTLEYLTYVSLLAGLWQVWKVYQDWSQFSHLKEQFLLPDSFFTLGLVLLVVFGTLYVLSLIMFAARRRLIGPYRATEWEENFDEWEKFSVRQEPKKAD